LDEIQVGFVEREATPRLLMKLGIQLHLAGLSLSNTVSILEIFGVDRARFAFPFRSLLDILNAVPEAVYFPWYLWSRFVIAACGAHLE
jgi:hypothetical protein